MNGQAAPAAAPRPRSARAARRSSPSRGSSTTLSAPASPQRGERPGAPRGDRRPRRRSARAHRRSAPPRRPPPGPRARSAAGTPPLVAQRSTVGSSARDGVLAPVVDAEPRVDGRRARRPARAPSGSPRGPLPSGSTMPSATRVAIARPRGPVVPISTGGGTSTGRSRTTPSRRTCLPSALCPVSPASSALDRDDGLLQQPQPILRASADLAHPGIDPVAERHREAVRGAGGRASPAPSRRSPDCAPRRGAGRRRRSAARCGPAQSRPASARPRRSSPRRATARRSRRARRRARSRAADRPASAVGTGRRHVSRALVYQAGPPPPEQVGGGSAGGRDDGVHGRLRAVGLDER